MTKTIKLPKKVNIPFLLELFGKEPHFFFLDSAKPGTLQNSHSYLGFNPIDKLTIEIGEEVGAIQRLNDFYHQYAERNNLGIESSKKEISGFRTGFLTFMTYTLGLSFLGLESRFQEKSKLPLAYIGYYPIVIDLNEGTGRRYLHYEEDYEKQALTVLEQILNKKRRGKEGDSPGTYFLEAQENYQDYYKKIEAVKKHIYEGDVYQVNYTRQFRGIMRNLNEDALFLNLRKMNPAPFSAYIKGEDWSILSSSPERLLRCRQGKLETKPIKGTIPVAKNTKENEKNKELLRNSEKDRAELLMIVDLERNDLSKVSVTGTVTVKELYGLETYETVHHLVSTITSQKKPELSPFDVLYHFFPGGSITGTPKKRAMEIIDKLEDHPRGIYTGSIGYIDQRGDFDFNIAIRTLVRDGKKILYNVGGGITWKSNPLEEFNETEDKGRGLKRGLGNEN